MEKVKMPERKPYDRSKWDNPNTPIAGSDAGELFENDKEKKAFAATTLNEMMPYLRVQKVKNDEEFIDRTEQYFAHCAERGIRPTWEEFALACGTTRWSLHDWETGRYYGGVSPDLVKRVKEFIAAYDARAVSEGKLNPVTYIFRSKNYYGMKDQQEHILTPNTNEPVDRKTLIEQAEMLPDIDTTKKGRKK